MVVVGGGVAGQRAAFSLRERGYVGRIVLICAEPVLPYDRTMLSKFYLDGSVSDDAIGLVPNPRYEELQISVILGVGSETIDARERAVLLSDGNLQPYSRLIVCTGGRPIMPLTLAAEGSGALRTLADARELRDRLAASRRVVVIGGGWIGGEVASGAIDRGIEVVENDLALTVERTLEPRRIAVVGGGPAGMVAGLTLAERGHEVALFEQRALGGALNEATRDAYKSDLRAYMDYLIGSIERSSVEVVLMPASVDAVHEGAFSAVVVASGACPSPISCRVGPGARLCAAIELDPHEWLDADAVIVGAGYAGVEAARAWRAKAPGE